MMRLVQLQNESSRRMALVEEPHLRLLNRFDSVYALAQAAISSGESLTNLISSHVTQESLPYDSIYHGQSDWHLLPPMDHPQEPARSLVSGTGLTHLGSAKDRQAMHEMREEQLTDSMKMFRWGVEGGRPAEGQIGVAPEWFYKGNGMILRAHNQPLVVPSHAEDGGEEGEIAGVYLIGRDGNPHRIGMCNGNEFSDHVFEKKNYLNLAGSKIRTCSIGPELVIAPEFDSIAGRVELSREGKIFWSNEMRSGEAEMCHSLRNIEHHLFKFETHRRPGDVHVHYFGAFRLSFGEGVRLQDGDWMQVGFNGFGRALRNPVRIEKRSTTPVSVKSLV